MRALYYTVTCSLLGCIIYLHIISHTARFSDNGEYKTSLFSLQLWHIYHSKKNSARCHYCAYIFMESPSYSCQVLMELEFIWHLFRKVLKYQFLLKSVQWEPSFLMRTDGRTDVTKLIVAFRNFDNKKVELALQTIKPGFSTAKKFKVNLAPDYLPVEMGICLSQKHPVCLNFFTCSILRSANAQVLTNSFYCVFALSVYTRSTLTELSLKAAA
jgi:hypothetical protein